MTSANQNSLALGTSLLRPLAENWWLILIRGIAAIVFGILAFLWPGLTLLTLVFLYAAYALVDGVFSIVAAIRGGTMMPRWWLAVVGVLGIAAGIIAVFWPGITALALVLVIGWWSIVKGIFEIVGAIRLRNEIDNEWMLIFAGVFSVLFGLALVIFPGAGALALLWFLGASAIVIGVMLVGLAFRLRGHKRPA